MATPKPRARTRAKPLPQARRPQLTRPAMAICSWALAQVLATGLFVGTCEVKNPGFGQCRVPWAVFLLSVVSGGQMSVALLMEAFRLPTVAGALSAAANLATQSSPPPPPANGALELPAKPAPRRRRSQPADEA